MVHNDAKAVFNPDMLRLARGSAGKTQTELADLMEVSQGKISKWEDGLREPSQEEVQRLGEVLRFTPEFFYQTDAVYGFGTCCMYHRKRQSLQTGVLNSIHDRINFLRIGISRLLRNVEMPEHRFEPLDIDEYGPPGKIAQLVRTQWQLPYGPVRNLVGAIEAAGGIVVPFRFGTKLLDAVSQWPRNMPPLFFVNNEIPADRWRFSLAHELGHIIMHRTPSPTPEPEADSFAAEFLMPERDILPDLHEVTVPKALRLKSRWRVSMQAIIRRAKDTGAITPRKYTSLNAYISKLGYKKDEPEPIAPEYPTTMNRLIDVHQNQLGYDIEELSRLVYCYEDRFRRRYLGEDGNQLRIVRDTRDTG